VASVALAVGLLTPAVGQPVASANPECKPTFTFGVGGFTVDTTQFPPDLGQPSLYIPSDQPVGYNSLDITDGVRELDRLFNAYRSRCPSSHIKILGHSGGAAVVHVWVSQNKHTTNVTAILAADPKRPAGPGGPGLAGHLLAAPADWLGFFRGASGTDADFGNVPVLTICNDGDWVCNINAGAWGYATTHVHGNYDLNPWNYPNFVSGQWYRPIYE
jgi:cutinase